MSAGVEPAAVWCHAWHIQLVCQALPLRRRGTVVSGAWHYVTYTLWLVVLSESCPFTLQLQRHTRAIVRSAILRDRRIRAVLFGL